MPMPMQITAQQIKTRWTAIIDEQMKNSNELFLSVRWEPKYVIINMNTYNKYREVELENAILETKQDIRSWKFSSDIDSHIKEINNEI